MTNEDENGERQRLQPIYAGLGDSQLLNLRREMDELTDVGQQVLIAEMASRGLEPPREDEAEAERGESASDGEEAAEVRLFRFNFAGDAETAAAALEQEGIPSRIDRARGRETEDGPEVYVPGLDLLISAGDEADAKNILRKKMQLFPLAEVDGGEDEPEEESLFVAGTFDREPEADRLVTALSEAGLKATKMEVQDADGAFFNVGVDFDDLDAALDLAEKLADG